MRPEVWAVIEPLLPTIIVVVVGGLISGYFLVRNRREGDRAKADTVAPPTFGEMYAMLIETADKVKTLEARVATLEAERDAALGVAKDAQTETSRIKGVVRGFFARLFEWDKSGRPGRMPMPSPEDLRLLEITIEH